MRRALILAWDADIKVSLSECIKSLSNHLNVVGQTSFVTEAVALYRDLNPDLVVVAEKMQDGSGLSFLHQIHRDPCDRVFLCSSESSWLEALVYGAIAGKDERPDISRAILHAMSRRNRTIDDLYNAYYRSINVTDLDRIALPSVNGLEWTDPRKIVWASQGTKKSTLVGLQDRLLHVSWSFSRMKSILFPLGFVLNSAGELVRWA